MQCDEVIWQVINQQFCSFKTRCGLLDSITVGRGMACTGPLWQSRTRHLYSVPAAWLALVGAVYSLWCAPAQSMPGEKISCGHSIFLLQEREGSALE